MTVPGVVALLVAVAAVEGAASRCGRRSLVTGRRRHAVSAAGLDVLSAALTPERERELEQRRSDKVRRHDQPDGAPPGGIHVDLASRVARVRR
jgi:hypothetical protein